MKRIRSFKSMKYHRHYSRQGAHFSALVLMVGLLLAVMPLSSQTLNNTTGTNTTTGTSGLGLLQSQTQALSTSGISSQTKTQSTSLEKPEITTQAQIAMSTAEYPVTPGDVYSLSYMRASQPESLRLVVEGDSTVNIGFLGKISASGMTFRAFKTMVEQKVEASYPNSTPSLLIVSTGTFLVTLQGAVPETSFLTGWGLSRLSDAVTGKLFDYSSIRDIQITSSNGKIAQFDLFKALQFGEIDQNPLLRPGDSIEVKKASRIARIEGQVRRPGYYQLLAGEGVSELVRDYAGGFLPEARTEEIVLTRKASAEKPESESLVFDFAVHDLPTVMNGDTIRVASREEYLPVVYIEGALQGGLYVFQNSSSPQQGASSLTATQPQELRALSGTKGSAGQTAGYGLVRIVHRQGQKLSQVMEALKAQLYEMADLQHAYILRAGERIDIDLEQILFQYREDKDIPLAAGDRIIIPYGFASVYLKGEVLKSSVIAITPGLRLSDVLKDSLSPLSSKRDIAITGLDGATTRYDFFKYERFGDITQNPLLRSGDSIEVQKATRIVQIEGEVRKPGAYQILPNEGIQELIGFYGDGTTSSAKIDLAILVHKASAEKPESEMIVFDVRADELPALLDGDKIRIPSQEEYLPVVYVEGAIVSEQNPTGYTVQRAIFRQGQTVFQLVKPLEAKISPKADLKNAYLARGAERIPLNLEKILYSYSPDIDMPLMPDDHLVIPFGMATATIRGEVKKSAIVEVTPGLRLADALKENWTAQSSQRDVRILSADGKSERYDLFQAERHGDITQNPLLRPGDQIEVAKADRFVQIEGEVHKPGVYQLLEGEGVLDLLNVYADGMLVSAKTDRIVLTRMASENIVFDAKSAELPMLMDGDRIRVASQEEYLPVVYIEGAIQSEQVSSTGGESYATRRVAYRKGQLLSDVMRPLESKLSPKANLKKAYIARGTAKVSVNLEKLLYFYVATDDVILEPEDRIVIPFGLNYAYLSGEVKNSSAFEVTSQTTLLQVLKDQTTPYSSLRDVAVTSQDGSMSIYDLFKAERFGDTKQNPPIRPGDVIEVKKAQRIIQVQGEIRRPGAYQLIGNESIHELIEYYGDGLLPSAKSDSLVLTRKASAEKPSSESIVFDFESAELPVLLDGDSLRVASREEYLPVVYLEGAVQSGTITVPVASEPASSAAGAQATTQKDAYGRIRITYRQGQLLSNAIKAAQSQLSANADLRHAYISRGNDRIYVDIEKLLDRYEPSNDIVLQEGDRIVIPYGYASVYVKGEVQKSSVLAVYAGMRLSDALQGNVTSYSSQRDIKVTSEDGSIAHYDLFVALRDGDLGQNPLLRAGDSIEVQKAARTVKIEGQVSKPGAYQLLASDGVQHLVARYGDGTLPDAKTDSLVLVRAASAENPEGESIIFDVASATLPALLNGDILRVPSREEYLPVMYVEGAIAGDTLAISSKDQSVSATAYSMLRVQYRKGATVASILRPLKAKILSSADMAHAFVTRKGIENQTFDLEKLLYANDLSEDIALQPEDRIVIPFGSMYVFVTGEVTKSSWVGITGLTRLRDVVAPLVTRYSSIRDVIVKSADGIEKSYDLFNADRYGDLSQDPFLRPGDEIRLSSLKNLATIQGEVKRPGTYQLLPGEGLKELIEVYADGFTEKANTSRLSLLHYLSENSPVGEKLQFDYAKFPDMKLRLYDVVNVPSLQELLPVVWFEGAVGVGSTGSSPETSQRVAYNFVPGETASQAALNNRKLFSAVSDLAAAYILHADGSQTAVNLAKFIYEYDLTNDIPLSANDTFIVPFRQFFVSVSGAVRYPGRYPYIPNRTWEYYIGLAGGFDTDRNAGQKIAIYDVKSQKVAIGGRPIQPEDNIIAESNSFTYNMLRISGIVSTMLSLAALIINLLKL